MPYFRTILDGERVSVWTTQQGTRTSDDAIISAHGETAFINDTFPQGTYSLVYFCPHKSNLVDPGLVKFWEYKVVAEEPPTTSPFGQDYLLTKYQGKHNKAGETYDLIESLDTSTRVGPDIITVSNDKSIWGMIAGSDIKLSALIAMVFEKKFDYKRFHCAFCRGTAPMLWDDPTHNPVVYI